MGYVPPDCAAGDTVLAVEINGRMHPAKVRSTPAFDPEGLRMRG
jgi:glycine cleavage system aminomethyltransferase T